MEKVFGNYSLDELLAERIDLIKEAATDKKICVELEVEKALPKLLYGDKTVFCRMLDECLGASLEILNGGYLSIYVNEDLDPKVRYKSKAKWKKGDVVRMQVTVSDSSEGISAEKELALTSLFAGRGLEIKTVKGLGTSYVFVIGAEVIGEGEIGDISGLVESFETFNVSKKEEKASLHRQKTFIEDIGDDFPEIPDINWEYGVVLCKDKTVVLEAARQFYQSIDNVIESLNQLWSNLSEDLDNYRIKVHAIKGTVAIFGAMNISSIAKVLEYAARDGDIERIKAVHPVLMDMLYMAKQDWSELKENDSESKQQIQDYDKFRKDLLELRQSIVDIDFMKTDKIVKESIEIYSYGIEIKDYIDQLIDAIKKMDDVKAIEFCDEILEVI